MTKKLICLLLAVLTALTLVACGNEVVSVEESSQVEALQTFGDQVDPSAEPSAGEIIPDNPVTLPSASPSNGEVTEGDAAPSGTGSGTAIGEGDTTPVTTTATPSPTKTPTTTVTTTTSPSPTIAPPEPASSATVDDATNYIGKSLSEFIADHGYPVSSDYQYIDEDDPDQGETGKLIFDGFVITTKKTDSGEIITSVTKTGGSSSQGSGSSSSGDTEETPSEVSPDPEDPMAPTE